MADKLTVVVTGLKELEQSLLKLGQDVGATAIVNGAYNSAKIIQDTMKANIVSAGAYDTGLLYKSISRKKRIYNSDGTVSIITGVNSSTKGYDANGNLRRPIRYAHLVEKNKPFAENAYDSTKTQVVQNFQDYLKKVIAKHAK